MPNNLELHCYISFYFSYANSMTLWMWMLLGWSTSLAVSEIPLHLLNGLSEHLAQTSMV